MKITKYFILYLIINFLCSSTLLTSGQSRHAVITTETLNPSKLLPLDPLVRTGKLPNGFTYFIRHNEEPKSRVVMYLANKAGSILEDNDQRGLAHFMEHMSFNGTKHFPKNSLVDYLQKAGIRFGADINAYTSFDETVYQLPLPSDKLELLKNGLQIMRDWAQEATLDATEINKERGVVLEEKRLAKGASERMRQIYYPLLLNHSLYADRLPIGADTVLNNFQATAIKRFYHDWYRPDLQALIIVGDINVNDMERMVKAKFGDLKNPKHERSRTRYSAKLTGNNQFISVTDREMTSTVLQVLIKHTEQKLVTESDYRAYIIRSLLNQMLGARYAQLSRQADPTFISGAAGISSFLAGLDIYSVSVTPKSGEIERGVKSVWRETIRAKLFGFTASELERAKHNYLNHIAVSFWEKDKTPSDSYVQQYLQFFLKGVASPGTNKEYQFVKKNLPGISLYEVDQLFRKYINTVNRDILILAPEKDKSNLPDQQIVENWLTQVEAEKLFPYKDDTNKLQLLVNDPISGKIIKQESDDVLHVTTLILSNGVKVILKPTDFKNDQVLFSGFAPGGTSVYSDADYQSANNATSVISASGIGNFNQTDLGKYLSGKQVVVSPFINERWEGINGFSAANDLENAMKLIYARFTEPRKDIHVFESIIARSKANLVNRANDPNSVFQDTISKVMSNSNFRRTGPSVSKLDQINLDRAFKIYQERFSDASAFTFVFTGSFTIQGIKPLLEKYLATLPATHSIKEAKDLCIHLPNGRIEKTVFKGSEPKASVNLVFSGLFDYSTTEKWQIDALKEVLEIRLLERLREDESGVYSPSVNYNVSKFPQSRYIFSISFGCAPQNVEKLISSALDEVNKLRTLGPSQINIEKYKAADISARETLLKTNTWWLNYLTSTFQNQDDLYELNHYEKNIATVTIENLKNLANKYLSGKNFMRFVLLPGKQ